MLKYIIMERITSSSMPAPRHGGGTAKAVFWAFLAILLVGGAAFWLYSKPETREFLREEAAEKINSVASGTPLAGIGDILRATPPPPPPMVLNPPTEKGTLSGRTVTGTIASPVDLPATVTSGSSPVSVNGGYVPAGSGMAEASVLSQHEPQPVFGRDLVPPATEDTTVRPGYLAELARWLASRYRPGANGGALDMNVQALNHLGGVTIASQARGGRASLLRYAFQPSMLSGLYNLYINRFMSDLDSAARQRGLDARQNRQFHLALAGRALLVAGALDGIAKVPELGKRLTAIDGLAQKTVDINEELTKAVFELDELREKKAAAALRKTAQMRVDGFTARYRRAAEEHTAAQRALCDDIRKNSGQTLDDESLLFLAAWVERRLSSDSTALAALRGCSSILRDLAAKCSNAAANP